MIFNSDILFTGYYGQQNTGDDAFVEVASWGANKYWNKTNNRFLAKSENLPKTLFPVSGYPLTIPKTYSLQADCLLSNTQAFIYAGGSTIHSRLSPSNIRYKAVQRKKNGKDLKYGAIGVSIGPFKSIENERAIQSYLKHMDFLAVRDQASYDIVSEWDLPYNPINAFDLAALLPEIYNYLFQKKNNQIKIIGISVCPYESHQVGMNSSMEIKRNTMLIDLIKKLDKLGNFHFRFYVINGNPKYGDLKLTTETVEKASPKNFEIFYYNKNTKLTWESIAQCDLVVSTRLHAAIFACFAEVPFMLNEYHRKCGDFLNNVGYNNMYRLFNSEFDVNKKAEQIVEIVNNPSIYSKPKHIKEMTEKARINFTAINF
ncbi:polysaccharide pyruvyl transferase [Aequorivita aquimaris]|uniref:Polysaccharide pyruvyl transferase n=1 Tax=Aequorivita aquimaris TaxID=1548749 RepID=A0A137RLC7_9FLAO|nr:polysaccharide pyruvyl transferase family protein [Aequorivita aquimaris]KXO00967.1 polysaccharide pyruvyl transferase [Aequorivita aquimaris]